MVSWLPRRRTSTPQASAIWRRFSSSGPHRLARLVLSPSRVTTWGLVFCRVDAMDGSISDDNGAAQRISHGLGHPDIDHLANQAWLPHKVDGPVIGHFAR